MKNYTPEMIALLKTNGARTELLTMELAGGTIRLTSAAHDIVFGGSTYVAGGLIMSVGSNKQQQALRIESVSVQFTVVDQTILALFQSANQIGRKALIQQLVLNDDNQPVGTALLAQNFTIDGYSVDDDEASATMTVALTNSMARFDSVRGIRTTMDSFRRFYPQSTSFINSKSAGDDFKWGGK